MANNNSKVWMWIFSAVVFPTLFFMGNSVIANDRDSRQRDTELKNELVKCVTEQKDVNKDILVVLAEMKSDLKYIKKNMDNKNGI